MAKYRKIYFKIVLSLNFKKVIKVKLTIGFRLKRIHLILFILLGFEFGLKAQKATTADFKWGNTSYFNINKGESIFFNDIEIRLVDIENQFNTIQIGEDTFSIKVSTRTLPISNGNLKVFVADNYNLKAISSDKEIHGLLKMDALIGVCNAQTPYLDAIDYIFPVSFNDGFLWNPEEDSYMFSYINQSESKLKGYETHPGIDFDLNDARGIEKHWILAIENSTVVWVEEKIGDAAGREACVLLESSSQPGIFYFYKHLNNKNVVVKRGEVLEKGDPIGTIWGDNSWGNLHFAVIKSETAPSLQETNRKIVNCFPQLYELYFKQLTGFLRNFTKGKIQFGKPRALNGNQKNAASFELYSGKGWITEKWNKADKVDYAVKGTDGNVRLSKTLFSGSSAESTNPENFYDYQINVHNGTYRIRAKIGDVYLPSWQKIDFNGIDAGAFSLKAGEFIWTAEKVVKVTNGKLTIRIFVNEDNEKPAGLSEIVFQKAI